MFDWVYDVFNWFNALGLAVDELISNYNQMMVALYDYIIFSTYYIYASGAVLFILLVFGISQKLANKRINKKLNALSDKLDFLINERGEDN